MRSIQIQTCAEPVWIRTSSRRRTGDFQTYSIVQDRSGKRTSLFEGIRIILCFHISRMEMTEHIGEALLSGQGSYSAKATKRISRILATDMDKSMILLRKKYDVLFQGTSIIQEMETYLRDHPRTTLQIINRFTTFLSWSNGVLLTLEEVSDPQYHL